MQTKTTGFLILGLAALASAHLFPITVPEAGKTYRPGDTVTVKWTIDIAHDAQDLAYSVDGSTWTDIKKGLAKNTTSFKWVVPEVASTTVRLRVCQLDGAKVMGCTDVHNAQKLAGYSVSGGEVYTAITGNFTISAPAGLQPASRNLGAHIDFDPATQELGVAFSMATAGRVTLQAFDTRGRLLATLADKPMSRGNHRLTLFSSALDASQVMVFRLRAGNQVFEQMTGKNRR